jgi:hypothetical protein
MTGRAANHDHTTLVAHPLDSLANYLVLHHLSTGKQQFVTLQERGTHYALQVV